MKDFFKKTEERALGVFKVLTEFKSEKEAFETLQLGRDKRANVKAHIKGTAYYKKYCISPKCQREFEATIRGLYCNYAPNGNGASCRMYVMRRKHAALEYLFILKLIFIILLVVLIHLDTLMEE